MTIRGTVTKFLEMAACHLTDQRGRYDSRTEGTQWQQINFAAGLTAFVCLRPFAIRVARAHWPFRETAIEAGKGTASRDGETVHLLATCWVFARRPSSHRHRSRRRVEETAPRWPACQRPAAFGARVAERQGGRRPPPSYKPPTGRGLKRKGGSE